MLNKVKQWLEPPYFPRDEEKNAQARTMNKIGLYFLLVLIFSAAVFVPFFAKHRVESWAIILALLVLYGVSRYFMFRGQLLFSSTFMITAGSILGIGLILLGGGITSPMTIVVVAIIVVIGMLFPPRTGIIVLLVSIFGGLGLAVIEQSGIVRVPEFFTYSPLSTWLIFTLALVFMNITMRLTRHDLESALALSRQRNDAREKAEQALRQSEERFQMFMQHFPGLAYMKDSDGHILFANQGFSTYLGLDLKNMIGKTNLEIFGPGFGEHLDWDDQHVLESRTPQVIEEEFAGRTWTTYKFCIDQPDEVLLGGITLDVTERKRAEANLSESQQLLQTVMDNIPQSIFWKDGNLTYMGCNKTFAEDANLASPRDVIGKTDWDMPWKEQAELYRADDSFVLKSGAPKLNYEEPQSTADGSTLWLRTSKVPLQDINGTVYAVMGMYEDITDRKHAEEALRRNEELLRAAVRIANFGVFDHDQTTDSIYWSPRQREIYGVDASEPITLQTFLERIHPEDRERIEVTVRQAHDPTGDGLWDVEHRIIRRDGAVRWLISRSQTFFEGTGEKRHPVRTVGATLDITERQEAENALRESENRFRLLVEQGSDIITILNLDGTARYESPAHERILGYTSEEIIGSYPLSLVHPDDLPRLSEIFMEGIEKPGYTVRAEYRMQHKDGTWRDLESFARNLADDPLINGIIINSRDVTERKQREHQLEVITALSAALRAAPTRAQMLPVIVEQIADLLNCDSASVEIIDPQSGDVKVEAAHGAWEALIGSQQKKGTGINAIISQTRQPYILHDLKNETNIYYPQWAWDGIQGSAGVPLVAQESLIGFIWVGRKTDIAEVEVHLLTAIADIAANAIHRATLHEQTQKDALELALAYDTTLEGWANALELRDQDTEGHTRRVVEMTLDLAKKMGISKDEMENIRRGALLHDIGKMGIPDSVLLKPGTLNEREWEIMKRHSEYAYKLLHPIEYLRPALDIPYCHHENWDGTGYPRGLRGEEIPLTARIFSIVDMWDALTSNRPYRLAWTQEQALQYIKKQSGKHFDPRVVDAFVNLIAGVDQQI